SLRGFAALWVCWFHACLMFFPASQDQWWSLKGYLGVQLFFVISGFVIPYSLEKAGYLPTDLAGFLFKRLARLHPPFLISIGLMVAAACTLNFVIRGAHYQFDIFQVMANAFLAAPIFGYEWMLKAYWT